MDLVVLFLVIWFRDGTVEYRDRSFGEDIQTCSEEAEAIKTVWKANPVVDHAQSYCVRFSKDVVAKK